MRNIILLFLNLLIMHAAFAQQKCRVGELNTSISTIQKTDTATRITLRCYRVIPDNPSPLLVINNKITPLGQLSAVNPHDIERVQIIKSPEATAIYGAQGVNGVIIVLLKTTDLSIVDATNGDPISFATLKFNTLTEEFSFIADSAGYAKIPTANIKTSFTLQVTSAGFKPFLSNFDSLPQEIKLERKAGINDTVVVSGDFTTCRKRVKGCCNWGISCRWMLREEKEESPVVTTTVYHYPNPVRTGASFIIEMSSTFDQDLLVSIYTVNGNLLRKYSYKIVKGSNRINITTASSWTPGLYFIEINEPYSHTTLKSKFIIQ